MFREEILERLERENREWLERLDKKNDQLLKQIELMTTEILHQGELLRTVAKDGRVQKDFYSVEEFAAMVKRKKFTVRQWCNLGLIQAQKSFTRSGPSNLWVISHGEYLRYQREGLLARARARIAGAGREQC